MTTENGQSARNFILPLVIVGLLLSIGSFLYFFSVNAILAYPDAQSHLLIARRVCDSSSPGFAQLGAVWLPLTHILSLPLVCSDVWANTWWGSLLLLFVFALVIAFVRHALISRSSFMRTLVTVLIAIFGFLFALALRTNVFYTSGIGMIFLSMIAYVLTGVFMYRFTFELTEDQWTSVIAWMVFMLNPNILYLQATAMTELPLYFGVIASMYSFKKLTTEPSKLKWLFLNGIAAVIMTTVRYEGWTILLAEAALYGFILICKRYKFSMLVGHLIQWGYIAFAGVVGWIVWNTTIFSNPLEFQNGSYSKPSNWVSGTEAGVGNLRIAAGTYAWGMFDTIGILLFVGLVAFIVYLLLTRLRKESYAILLPLVMIPFFVYMIFKGQRPMQAMEIEGSIYNARFALIVILSVAPLIGFLVQRRILLKILAVALILVSTVFMLKSRVGVITLTEPLNAIGSKFTLSQLETAKFLKDNYDGSSMLMESYGNEQVQFMSGINLKEIIYEGSYRLWTPILDAPYANNIKWILMRGSEGGNIASLQPDLVWQKVRTQQSFLDHYTLVFQNDIYQIFRLKSEQ